MRTKQARSFILAIGIAFAWVILMPHISTATSELPSTLLQTSPAPIVNLKTAFENRQVDFYPGNDDRNPVKHLPHLVLFRDGALTADPNEQTLELEVIARDIYVSPGTTAMVEVRILTQHADPDLPPFPPPPKSLYGKIARSVRSLRD